MNTTRPVVRGLNFDPDGALIIEYCTPASDIRKNGIILNHTIFLPLGDQYDDEINAVHEAIQDLLKDVFEDLPHIAPVDFTQPDEDDDDDDPDE